MTQPRFRFIDGGPSPSADAQFWRDCEASERLGSRFKANLFLRELCHSKAWEDAAGNSDPDACAVAERRLLGAVLARGYNLFGPDLDHSDAPCFADAS